MINPDLDLVVGASSTRFDSLAWENSPFGMDCAIEDASEEMVHRATPEGDPVIFSVTSVDAFR